MLRIGVATPGDPSDRSTWSGTPSGVMRGLDELGVEAVPINVQPAAAVDKAALAAISAGYVRPGRPARAAVVRAREAARASRTYTRLQTLSAPHAVRRAGRLDGIIQIGTGFGGLPSGVPVVTYEDMTVLQTKTHTYPGWDLLSEKAFDSRVERQRRAYHTAAGCCMTSEWAAQSVIDDYGIDPEKVHAVGVGRNHEAPNAIERDWETPKFLFVGLDWKRKNGDAVVKAFGRLREDVPAAQLHLVGGHPPIGSIDGVVGHGILRLDSPEQRAELDNLFGSATCFIMPSFSEASAISYVEAAASGMPSIGTRNGGSDFLIGDGGIVVDPLDDDAILAAMKTLSDPLAAQAMGASAKERSNMFTWTKVAERLVGALQLD